MNPSSIRLQQNVPSTRLHRNYSPAPVITAIMFLFSRISATFLVCLLLLTGISQAQEADSQLPTEASLQSALDDLADRHLADEDSRRVRTALEQGRSFLEARRGSLQAQETLRKQLQEAPAAIAQYQNQLAELKRQPETDTVKQYGESALKQLELLLTQRNEQVTAWQQALSDINTALAAVQSHPERMQQDIGSIQDRRKSIDNALKSDRIDGQQLIQEQRWQLQAELAALSAQEQLLRQQLLGNGLLLSLYDSKRNLLTERIRRHEKENLDLQNLISEKRRVESEKAVADAIAGTGQDDHLLNEENTHNQRLSTYLLQATDRYNELARRNLEAKQALDNLQQIHQSLDQQIHALHGSMLLSRILNEQKQALPSVRIQSQLTDQIADLRLHQFELNKLREQLNDPVQYLEALLKEHHEEQATPELQEKLNVLVSTRRMLVSHLNDQINALLNEAVILQLTQQQLQASRQSLQAELDEQLFWIPSNPSVDPAWFKTVPQKLVQQIKGFSWPSIFIETASGLVNHVLLSVLILVLIGCLIWKRPALKQRLASLTKNVGHFKHDNQLNTPFAILICLLLTLPVTLAITAPGLALTMDDRGQNLALGHALLRMALAWTVFSTFHRILLPHGIAERHFQWPPTHVAFLNKNLTLLGIIVIILVGITGIAQQQSATLADDIIGVIVILLAYAAMTAVLARLLFPRNSEQRPSSFKIVVGGLFILIPALLFIAVCLGYYYTALRLTDRSIETLYLLILWLLVDASCERALSVAARKLAYSRALAKREATAKENAEGIEVSEEPTLAIEQVNQQSLRLIRLAQFIVFGILLYWIWSDVIGVISYLDNFTLYEYTTGSGNTLRTTGITLNNLLAAVVVGLITIALAKNLPGLMEVLFLSHIRLAQGSSYAFTTLLTYIICATGIVTLLSTLGISWDKLQWLVAALGVGLGFGLQELFSNFISGLIILFERPVRIGDTVTIGTVSGTVTRIRIRATTLMDFEHKEVIIPNKTFILGQVINWTLSDTITRLTINVSVTADNDLDQVKALLYRIAEADEHVLKDPRPSVNQLNVSGSILNYELNVYVREMAARRTTLNALNKAIEETFSKHYIGLA